MAVPLRRGRVPTSGASAPRGDARGGCGTDQDRRRVCVRPHRPDSDAVVAEGQRIYARKPNMGEHDVTWSQAEYGHLGLQKEYIRYKSVQRLTEAWACLQRARQAGIFARLTESRDAPGSIPLRWASLGGGPGFELLAVRWFFERHYPAYDLDLVSLDLEKSWREAAEGLGLRFHEWDVRDGDGLERAAGGPSISPSRRTCSRCTWRTKRARVGSGTHSTIRRILCERCWRCRAMKT